jgi:hypothetical protein
MLFKWGLICSLLLISCSTQEDGDELDFVYISEVKVVSPQVEEVKVDNFRKTIEILFERRTDLSAVELELTLAEGVRMVKPETVRAVYDLTRETVIQLEKNNRTISFKIVALLKSAHIDISTKDWAEQNTFGELPDYLALFKYRGDLPGKSVKAYIAVADVTSGKGMFRVLGEKTGSLTPAQFYQQNNQPVVVLNGGYFWSGTSLGLIIRNGQPISHAQPVVNRTYNGTQTPYYPTQGAFGMEVNGIFTARWVYESDQTLYSYPAPAPNKGGEQPLPVPSATFPQGAVAWKPKEAIGAGPLLIKNGKYQNLWENELFDEASGVGPTYNHPRSAIAYHPNGYLIFFVCEGRNKTANTPGLTLKEVADLLLDLGCSEAINLDGGGSSCMLMNGKETIIPSDGKQRSLPNIVAIY